MRAFRVQHMKRGFTILLADDDDNDAEIFKHVVAETAQKSQIAIGICVVRDGVEAIDYLSGQGGFQDRETFPFPFLIVLVLKMPRLTGLDVLQWLAEHPEYRRVPKVLLSGSAEERDIDTAYRLGVNTYFQKPSSLTEFRVLIHLMINYWARTQRPVIRHAFV